MTVFYSDPQLPVNLLPSREMLSNLARIERVNNGYTVGQAIKESYGIPYSSFGDDTSGKYGSSGASYNTVVGDFARWLSAPDTVDPDFSVTPDMVLKEAPELMDRYDDLSASRNRTEFYYKVQNMRDHADHREKMAKLGWKGTTVDIASYILDPAFLLTLFVSRGALAGPRLLAMGGELTAAGRMAAQGGRLSRLKAAGKLGIISGAEMGVVEGARAGLSDEHDLADVPLHIALGAAFGGTIGGLFPKTAYSRGWNKLRDEISLRQTAELLEAAGLSSGRLGVGQVPVQTVRQLQAEIRALEGVVERGQGGLNARHASRRHYETLTVKAITGAALKKEAALYGIKTSGRKVGEIRKDLVNARLNESTTLRNLAETIDDPMAFATKVLEAQKRGRISLRSGAEARGAGNARELIQFWYKYRERMIRRGISSRSQSSGIGRRMGTTDSLNDAASVLGQQRQQVRTLRQRLHEAQTVGNSRTFDFPSWMRHGDDLDPDDALRGLATFDHAGQSNWQRFWGWLEGAPVIGSVGGKMMKSTNELRRRFGTIFADDPMLRNRNPLATVAAVATQSSLTRLAGRLKPARDAVIKGLGRGRLGGRAAANKVIMRAIRSGETPSGPLGEAVATVREHLVEVLEYAKKNNLRGFENIPTDPRYLPRWTQRNVIRALSKDVATAGMQTFEETNKALIGFLGRSLRSGSTKEISESLSNKMAARYLRAQLSPEDYVSLRLHGKTSQKWRELEDQIRSEFGRQLDETEIDDFLSLIAPRKGNRSQVGAGRSRLEFDELYEEANFLPGGGTLRFDELLDNDLDKILHVYTQRIMGAVQWQRGVKALVPDQELDEGVESVIAAISKGEGGLTAGAANDIRVTFRSMHGLPLHSDATLNRWTRNIMDLSFVRVMNQVGFAQVPELYNAIAMNGLRASLQAVPALRFIAREAKTGRLTDDLVAEIEAATGIGGDILRKLHVNRLEEGMDFAGVGTSGVGLGRTQRALAKYERAMDRLKNVTVMNPLGLGPIDTALRRFAAEGAVQNWVNQAYRVKRGVGEFKDSWISKSRTRFKDLGFDDDEIDLLFTQFTKPGVVEVVPSGFGGRVKVKKLNLDKWDDQALADQFSFALYRHINRVIQRTEATSVASWMNHPMGRMAIQFRTFAFVAKSKQFAYNMRRLDGNSVNMMLGTVAFGSAAYYAQMQVKAALMTGHRREEFMKERLSPEALVKAGVMRAGWTSLFPSWIDSASRALGHEALISPYARSTGLRAGLVNGIPVADMMLDIYETNQNYIGPIVQAPGAKGRIDESDWRKLKQALPLQNLMGFDNLFNALIDPRDTVLEGLFD